MLLEVIYHLMLQEVSRSNSCEQCVHANITKINQQWQCAGKEIADSFCWKCFVRARLEAIALRYRLTIELASFKQVTLARSNKPQCFSGAYSYNDFLCNFHNAPAVTNIQE